MKCWRCILIVLVVGAAFLVMVTACASRNTPEPVIVTQRVEVPISVPCAADPGPDPAPIATAAAIAAAPGIFEPVKLLLAEIEQLRARNAELKAANQGCKH